MDTPRHADGDDNGQIRALVETCLHTNDLTPMVRSIRACMHDPHLNAYMHAYA